MCGFTFSAEGLVEIFNVDSLGLVVLIGGKGSITNKGGKSVELIEIICPKFPQFDAFEKHMLCGCVLTAILYESVLVVKIKTEILVYGRQNGVGFLTR